MKEMVEVETDGRRLRVTLILADRNEAWRLSTILAEAAESPACTERESYRWTAAAYDLRQLLELLKGKKQVYRKKVERPTGSNPTDMDWVVNGPPPFPVLSYPDNMRALRRLDAQVPRLPTHLIARRLYVDERTVYRMRRKLRRRKEKEIWPDESPSARHSVPR